MKLFIIGPGGVGKTTCGRILSEIIGYKFIDLDQEFCDRIENITTYIRTRGYEDYCSENSKLFYSLLSDLTENFIFSLSSGFLIYKELKTKHRQTLKEIGTSILLLPSLSQNEGAEIIAKRQVLRGLGLDYEREKIKFSERFHEYKSLADYKIFSHENPKKIAEQMKNIIYNS